MLNEPAFFTNDDHMRHNPLLGQRSMNEMIVPPQPQVDPLYDEIRAAVESVFNIHDEEIEPRDDEDLRQKEYLVLLPQDSQIVLAYHGQMRATAEDAYSRLDAILKPHDLIPVFRPATDANAPHTIYVVRGRGRPNVGGRWLSVFLFVATLLSVLFVGTLQAVSMMERTEPLAAQQIFDNLFANLWRGLPYASSILLILGAHELGHYFAARYHKTDTSLPYFLPFPFGIFGTFGAAIRLREPMRNRKVLFDIGAAGPLVGLVFAIPILFIGLMTSETGVVSSGLVEGNSLFYGAAKVLVFGEWLPNGEIDVYVNQLAWAGWTGLLVTGLNLIPIGQLDGGHVLYSLLGKNARRLYYPLIIGLVGLTIFYANELIIFVVLIVLMGNNHATPLDDITPLDTRRRNLALFTLGIFVLVFVPSPLSQVTVSNTGGTNGFVFESTLLMTMWLGGLMLLRRDRG